MALTCVVTERDAATKRPQSGTASLERKSRANADFPGRARPATGPRPAPDHHRPPIRGGPVAAVAAPTADFLTLSRPRYPPAAEALILISTPAGSDSLFKASIVLPVGWMMSISRLCVRISNCSRDFLSMCGLRNTV